MVQSEFMQNLCTLTVAPFGGTTLAWFPQLESRYVVHWCAWHVDRALALHACDSYGVFDR